jgi:tRNA/rRNA methyltransferase
MPENLGSVARVMGNFGLSKLTLVSPIALPSDPKAIALAAGADDILFKAIQTNTLQEAIKDCRFTIATTASPRHMIKTYETPRSFAAELHNTPLPLAVVFGPERTGLSNDQISLCQKALQIPINPDFPSLNLAQAVSLVAYELFMQINQPKPFIHTGMTKIARSGHLQHFLTFLEEKLDNTHFWRTASKKERMKRNLISLFSRQTLMEQDIKTLHGVVDALCKGPKK